MKLSDWLKATKTRKGDFAKRIGLRQSSSLTRYLNGRLPDRAILVAIKRETGGAVTADDFIEDEAAA